MDNNKCPLLYDDSIKKWIACDQDPRPECNHPTCLSKGKPNSDPKRLVILPRGLVLKYYAGLELPVLIAEKQY